MRRYESIISWTLLAGILGGFWYFFPNEIRTTAYTLYTRIAPCTIPISYRIGSIDPKFGISENQVKADLIEAASLWNTEAHKDLFLYDQEHGVVTVSLVYDSRQEMTKRLKSLGITVSNDRASYDAVKFRYDAALSDYDLYKKTFEQKVANFNIQKAEYEKNVAYWNSRGGAPRAEYQQLQNQQNALAALSQSLSVEQTRLNDLVQEVNDLARTLNKLIESLKLDVATYNATGSSHGDSFEQGVYERSVGKQTITIFEYENNALLTRVLAHELGHAVGLDHVEDPDAIMYYLNQGSAMALTKADVAALAKNCKKWW